MQRPQGAGSGGYHSGSFSPREANPIGVSQAQAWTFDPDLEGWEQKRGLMGKAARGADSEGNGERCLARTRAAPPALLRAAARGLCTAPARRTGGLRAGSRRAAGERAGSARFTVQRLRRALPMGRARAAGAPGAGE